MTELSKRLYWVSVYAIAMALFLVALVLMAVPSLMATWPGIWSTTQSKISKTLVNR